MSVLDEIASAVLTAAMPCMGQWEWLKLVPPPPDGRPTLNS